MKKQKKFTSEAQIIKAIDEKKARVPMLLADADRLEHTQPEEARKKRRSAFLIEDRQLPRLKRTLAAFRTETMPFVEDQSVVLEK